MYNRKLNKAKSKIRNLKYALRSAICGKFRGHKFVSPMWQGGYDGMGYFCEYCGAESEIGELVEPSICDTCKAEGCTHDRDFGNDCPYYEGV